MARGPADLQWPVDGRGVVVKARAEGTDPGINGARRVAIVRKLHQRMVLPQRNGATACRGALHQRTRTLAGEGQPGLDLGVEREGAGAGQIEGAAATVQLEVTLPRRGESPRHAVSVAQEEVRGIDKHAVAGLRFHLEAPVGGRGKSLLDGTDLVRVL